MEEEVVVPPPPPLVISPIAKPEKLDLPMRSIIGRHGYGNAGRPISLLTNHSIVPVKYPDEIFYQYSVAISSEDKRVVESKGIGRKAIAKLFQTYFSELDGKRFAYDGEKTLYTVGSLPQNKLEFTVLLEESFAKHFPLKVKNGDGKHDGEQTLEITVYEYFTKHLNIELAYSAYMPCLDVGKPKRPNYLPLEAVTNYCYEDDPFPVACGISIEKQLTPVDGRFLEAPKIEAQLSGRTNNEIKNMWNSSLKKKRRQRGIDPNTHKPLFENEDKVSPTSCNNEKSPGGPAN
ncbi:hypothetical protein U1Q18_028394 [Sarracenia purpurea var. burkii]